MRYVLALVVGLIAGAALVYFFFVGAPGGKPLPGSPVAAPDPAGDPPGTAVVELDEQFFNTLLGTIFRDVGAPTFKLASAEPSLAPADRGRVTAGASASPADGARFVKTQGGCASQVVVNPEGAGVKTGVRLADG